MSRMGMRMVMRMKGINGNEGDEEDNGDEEEMRGS